MKLKLNEGLPAMVPTYPVDVAGHKLTLRFDTNINKTKKGVKLQFVLDEVPKDPRELQTMANEIGTELQKLFGDKGLQIMYDVENPYTNVVGFLLPLTSLGDFIYKNVLGGSTATSAEPEQEPAEQPEEEPKEELPAKPVAEGLKRPKLTDLFGYT